jgi:uncharacterized protein involved in tolerance to divalent cations
MMSCDERELKIKLNQIKGRNFNLLATIDCNKLVEDMLEHIGALDSELRDDLIYETFAELILHEKISRSKSIYILDRCLGDDFIGYEIHGTDNNAVFRRSFSMLTISLVLEKDKREHILDKAKVKEVYGKICDVYANEQNIIGYTKGKGWAHTVAHTADAFESLVTSEHIGKEEITHILDLISEKMKKSSYYYIDGEDERTASVVETIVKTREDMVDKIMDWIGKLTKYEKPSENPERSIIKGNIRNLLRSIYFKCGGNPEIQEIIENKLKEVSFS